MMPDEQLLIEKAIEGDKQAFTVLVRQYQNRIFGFIMRMTANREAALDLTQDTFMAAYLSLGGFRREASFSTWLYQIAGNKTRNYIKRAQREVPLADGYDKVSPNANPDAEYEAQEQQKRLALEIAGLPLRQREIFTLRFFDQLKFAEIARIQNISVSAAKTSFAEALKKLKKRLAD
jgi:RNA polymerase sigma-70 factor (ECF subfamily)